MSSLRLATVNHVDSATLTASPAAVSTMPVTNLTKVARDRVFRSTSTADQQIKLTWGGDGKRCNFVALFRHNTHGAQWRIQLYSDAAWTTSVYDSGLINTFAVVTPGSFNWGVDPLGVAATDLFGADAAAIHYFTATDCASAIITIHQTGAAASYWEIGRAWLGQYYEPSNGVSYGAKLGWESNTSQRRSEGASMIARRGERWRRLELELEFLSDAERAIFMDAARAADTSSDVVVSVFPAAGGRDERDYTMAGFFTDTPRQSKWAYRLNSNPLAIVEI